MEKVESKQQIGTWNVWKTRSISAEYSFNNSYNQDQCILLYRMGPNRTYLKKDKTRRSALETLFQNHEERLTVIFGTNASGTGVLPVRSIGIPKSSVFFRNH